MKRIHNSNSKHLVFKPIENKQTSHKPIGLYYSIGNEWRDWCKSEEPTWVHKYNFELIINPEKILILDSYEEIKGFNQLYCKGFDVDWERVCKQYYGIELNPYLYESKFEFMWYSMWDVASGCIWNKKAIKKIIKL